MRGILRTEIKRSFFNSSFLISLGISTLLIIWYSIDTLPFLMDKNADFFNRAIPGDFLETSFTMWIGSANLRLQQDIFYFLIPILGVLPFGVSFFTDKTGGYAKSICVRTGKSRYLLSKYFAVFLSGGTAAAFPMVLSFITASAFLPSMLPEVAHVFTNILFADKWSEIFFVNPYLYMAFYTGLVYAFGGLLSCTALLVSCFSSKKFLPLIFPFFVYIISSLFFELIGQNDFSIRKVLETEAFGTPFSIIVMAASLFIISFVPYFIFSKRDDVL